MIIKPPTPLLRQRWDPTVFLAGSIEMGKATDWQATVGQTFSDAGFAVFNPRRDDWDPTWKQSISNPRFVEQVDWEMDGLRQADFVLFYFEPTTLAPVSLLELGLHANKVRKNTYRIKSACCVVCPEGFWRKGNVDIVCRAHNIPQFDTIETGVEFLIGAHRR